MELTHTVIFCAGFTKKTKLKETCSPTRADKDGAHDAIRSLIYSFRFCLKSVSAAIRLENRSMLSKSISDISIPIDVRAASTISATLDSLFSPNISENS